MADGSSSPLLGTNVWPTSEHSHHSNELNEDTPLLLRTDSGTRYDGSEENPSGRLASPAATSLRSLQNGVRGKSSAKQGRRWPSLAAVTVLGLLVICIILAIYFFPAAVEEYAKQALVVEPTNLSIARLTDNGVTARVQANLRMDASRVKNKRINNIGRFGTWIAQEVESQEGLVKVYIPEYGNVHLGTAMVPKFLVDLRNGHTTMVDFETELRAGDVEGIRQVANDWLEGRLDQIRFLAKAELEFKFGLISLGFRTISESISFEGNDLPELPKYNITQLNFREVPLDTTGRRGVAADVSLSLLNNFPVKFDIPSLAFDILVPGCDEGSENIQLADAITDVIHVEPNSYVVVDVVGIVRELPKSLRQICSHSESSPLDILFGNYIHGNETTIFVRGSQYPDRDTPEWITSIISGITVPVPFPGHTFDNLIKNFSLTDTNLELPNPWAEPGSKGADPTISGTIEVTAGLPKEMNFAVNVTEVRANSDVLYKGARLGVLNLKKWQPASSERFEPVGGNDSAIRIRSQIKSAPLEITDQDVVADVLSQLLFRDDDVMLKVEALVDVALSTVLGDLIIKRIPAEGFVPVKPISTGSNGFSNLKLKVGGIKILSTSKRSLSLEAQVNFTNPTEYSAHIPYINIHILSNGSIIGDATITNTSVRPGNNANIIVHATWDPTSFGGKIGSKIGREFLSQYISGYNTTLTFQCHNSSIPNHPEIGGALSKFAVEMPTPQLSGPGGDGDGEGDGHKPQFIDDATFHLLSSTATFALISPLRYSTLYIDSINATALYNHTEPIGKILYYFPFKVIPGRSMSPRLPVDWSLDSVGYEKLKEALGGDLKLDASATVGIRLGEWTETVWYIGHGIGASVRF